LAAVNNGEEMPERKEPYANNAHLFNALIDVCGFVALESDMYEIIRAVKRDEYLNISTN